MALVSGECCGAHVSCQHSGGGGRRHRKARAAMDTAQVPLGPVWDTGAIWNRWWGWGGVSPATTINGANIQKFCLPTILFSLQFIETKSHSVIQTSLEFLEMPLPQSLKCLDYRCELTHICISETHFQSTWIPCGRVFTHNYSKIQQPQAEKWHLNLLMYWGGGRADKTQK